MRENEDSGSVALVAFGVILACSVIAGMAIFLMRTMTEPKNRYIPITDTAYKISSKNNIYAYSQNKDAFKRVNLGKTIYLPKHFVVENTNDNSGNDSKGDTLSLVRKNLALPNNSTKKHTDLNIPVMLIDHFNYEKYGSGDTAFKCQQKWDKKKFLILNDLHISEIKSVKLSQKAKQRKVIVYDPIKEHDDSDNDDGGTTMLPIFLPIGSIKLLI